MKKEKEDKDEFDALVENNAKSLDDRLGNSPEKIEKKAGKKGGMYQNDYTCLLKVNKNN